MVRELFYRARDARRPLIQQWKKNYRVLNNRVWSPRAEPWMPTPEVSNIWPLVGSLVAWMTDQRPGCEVSPGMPPFSPFADHYDKLAEHMNAILDMGFSVNQEDAQIERLLWDVATYGVGYTKSIWLPTLADGKGDATFRRVDPFNIYPDPYARNMDEANYIIEAKIMSMDDLDRCYPGARQRVMAGQSEDVDESPHILEQQVRRGDARVNLEAIAPNTVARYGESNRNQAMVNREEPVVVVLEAWLKTHKVMTHREDPSIAEGQARVVERWRCVAVVNNTVLMDYFADEIYAFPTHPYDKMTLFDTGEWYGPSLVWFLTSPQESINRILSMIEMNLMLLGNPIMFESRRTNPGGRTTMTNRPGTIKQGTSTDVGFIQPPAIHPDSISLIQYYEDKLETISGLSAIMRGFSQSGRNSTDVMSSLQDSAFVRVRATLRNLERLLRGACSKKCANIAEFYNEPRMVYILGEDGQKTSLALKANHFYLMQDTRDDQPAPLRFSVVADAGSDHPTSRQSRQAQAERLYAMGAIDDLEILKAERWPNYPVVAGRVMDMKATAGTLGQPPGARQRTRSQ